MVRVVRGIGSTDHSIWRRSLKLSLILACLWVVGCSITAMMPMKYQIYPGLPLLIATPFMLAFLGYQYGIWLVLVGVVAFASLFRKPLIYFIRRALGWPTQHPRELERNKT